jgi:hypothetical protein
MTWFVENTPPGTRILTDRDDLLLLREHEVVGPRQVAAVPPRPGIELPSSTQLYFWTRSALNDRDLEGLLHLARICGAEYVVVPWPTAGSVYSDGFFSIVAARKDPGE